ncbi:hypothetical protein [Leptothermofonsia sp. ETS-13]
MQTSLYPLSTLLFFENYPDAALLFANTDMAGQKKKLLNALVLVI